jgi:5-formyltetrahydrofolate cyclo-ligase
LTDTRKAALRAEVVAARRRLPPELRAEASRAIAARVAALPAFAAAATVASYPALGAEVDAAPLAAAALAAGKRIAWPRMVPGRIGLAFASCAPEELVPGPQGTRQPPPGAAEVPVASLDLVLVPGVAFDAEGHRLGRGGGYYDSALASLEGRALRIGLAFDCQIVPAVPLEPHDARVDLVATESRLLGPRAGPPPG